MKKLLSLFVIAACTIGMQAFGLNVVPKKITKVNTQTEKIATAVQDIPASAQFSAVSDQIMSLDKALVKASEEQAGEEWLPFGTAYFNDAFNTMFASDYTAEKPLDVYVCVRTQYAWDLKIVNMLGADIIISTNLRTGSMSIANQATAIRSPYAGNGEGFYENYAIYMPSSTGTPFSGTIELPMWLLITNNSGYDLSASGYTMTLNIGKEWQKFGTATPNDGIVSALAIYNIAAENKAYAVDYLKLSDKLWVFMLRDFVGADIPIVSYIDARVSVAVVTRTSTPSMYYAGEDSGYFDNYHITSYFAGTPRDGEMWFPFWLLVSPTDGFNLNSSNLMMKFESELLSMFKVISTDCFITDKDNGTVTLKVERSDNITTAQADVYFARYNSETRVTENEAVSSGAVEIADDNTIKVQVNKGRGLYTVRLFGIDGEGQFGTQKNIRVYANTTDGHTWESAGTGLFKPYFYNWCWEGTSPWLNVELEKATDAEGLYRAVNPFRQDEILSQLGEGTSYNKDMDTYIYFGANNDYSIYQHLGIILPGNSVSGSLVIPSSSYDAATGIYDLNVGEFTLHGVKNYGIAMMTPTSARVTPHVNDVIYSVIPNTATADHDCGTDAARWLEAGASAIKHATPDAEHKVTFDNSECEGSVHFIAIATVDDNQVKQVYRGSLLSDGEGWLEVDKFNVSQFANVFSDDEITETVYSTVSINPFDRMLVKLDNPFKYLEGRVRADEFTTDFSVDRSLYLKNSPAGYVYSCSKDGEVLEAGGETGIFETYDENRFSPDYPQEYILDATTIRFQCETNVLYKSGYDDKRIAGLLGPDFAVPQRFGSLLVFPNSRTQLYSLIGTYRFLHEYSIFAPTDVTRDYALSEVDPATSSFAVGADIASVKLYYTEVGNEYQHPGLYEILTTNPECANLSVDSGKATAALPVGVYEYTAVAYDKDNNVANSVKGMVSITSGIENIAIDDEASAVYYNLYGVEVAHPEAGIYIVRRGNKVTKEIVK